MPEVKKVRAVLEDELVNGIIVKKGEVFETELADYLLNNYSNRRELVEDQDEHEEKKEKEEKKETKKKTSKKSK